MVYYLLSRQKIVEPLPLGPTGEYVQNAQILIYKNQSKDWFFVSKSY